MQRKEEFRRRVYHQTILPREFKENEALRLVAIEEFDKVEALEPRFGQTGLTPKSWKPFVIARPILWQNGKTAKIVGGDTPFKHPYEKLIRNPLYKGLSKKKYDAFREKYHLNE